jgi:ABC-2 type transport system permease protein
MRKLKAGLLKEFLLLINDKVGLSMMIFLPILLVIIITSIQNSAFNLVNNNQISLLVSNVKKDSLSNLFTEYLEDSKLFNITYSDVTEEELNNIINTSDILFGLHINANYSKNIETKAQNKIEKLKYSMGITDELISIENTNSDTILKLIYSPVVQYNYAQSIEQMIYVTNKKLSTSYLLNQLSTELDLEGDIMQMEDGDTKELIVQKSSFEGADSTVPNASQHNVPAWSIFAVFFMVVSLAVNFVKEKTNGSFDRILTMPSSIWYLLGSKALLFWMVSLFQVLFIFTISRFVFQFIGLPTLYFPDNMLGFIWVILLTGFTAVNYSLVVGIYSKTAEQANGFGALTVIIFSAIGGIWFPSFIMPPFLKLISNLSPLHWCIELFYTIFLKEGNISQLLIPSLILIAINVIFVVLAYIKLKRLNIIV